jgi:acetyl-CoA carboxylase biotin carboxyl carrier protein
MSMNLSEIQDLIKFVSKSGVEEVEIEKKDFKITIKSGGKKKKGEEQQQIVVQQAPMAMPQPVAMPAAAAPAPVAAAAPAPAAAAPAAAEDSNYITVKSPMIGTFYRSAGPGKDAFVSIGDAIEPGKVTCIVEAMKLFNEIESEISGKIVKVLVDDATPVEYDQPLFLVDPS